MWNKIIKIIKALITIKSKDDKPQEQNQSQSDNDKFAELNWTYGGFRGQAAEWNTDCAIADLNVKSNGLSYRWEKGGCEVLGANGSHNASETIACLFCLINGKWVGGKFDWISTSRTTRDFKNIATGYHGWDSAAIDKAEGYRFVIVSKDGKKRSNVIEVMR